MAQRRGQIIENDGCSLRVVHLERVKQAQGNALGESDLLRLSLLYKALGDPTRLKLVRALGDGEMCVCDLAAFLGVSESAVSHQLRKLREQGLVRSRRDGPVLYYTIADEHIAQLLSIGLEHMTE